MMPKKQEDLSRNLKRAMFDDIKSMMPDGYDFEDFCDEIDGISD